MTTTTAKQGKTVADKANASRASADVTNLLDDAMRNDAGSEQMNAALGAAAKTLKGVIGAAVFEFIVACGLYAVTVTFGLMGISWALGFMVGMPIMATIFSIFGLCIVFYGAMVTSSTAAPYVIQATKTAYNFTAEKLSTVNDWASAKYNAWRATPVVA